MKKILYLTFYFEPDLCAGSFRNSPLATELSEQMLGVGEVEVITTVPNRYSSYQSEALQYEERGNLKINRILIPKHQSGFLDQIKSFHGYYREVKKIVGKKKYDLVFASSSRLFTAYLGYAIAKKQKVPLYLDIRDIFVDTIKDVIKSRLLKSFLLPALAVVERRTFSYATHINLISEGFKTYFDSYRKSNYTYLTNGIDPIFADLTEEIAGTSGQTFDKVKNIVYAGNIGEGQGLHKVIPQAANKLGAEFRFRIIGDGGAKDLLLKELKANKVNNVEVINPLNRHDLIKEYRRADYLFIHLNDYRAFEKVLPSKVFELGVFSKPIIAGVSGYARNFIESNISNSILFSPCNAEELVIKVRNFSLERCFDRSSFVANFKRETINKRMAESIISYL